ncbi:MAG: glycosyltransferase [Anaerolineae bacterium]|nr:glycosyltransferase [Anaerolineae bacterium]
MKNNPINLNDLTIIVPTRNEVQNIPVFLSSIPENILVVMIDASDDKTCEIARKVRPSKLLIYRSFERIAGARHLGAQLASTNWLLFTDADINFDANYFSRLSGLAPADAFYGPKLSQNEYKTYYQRIATWQGISQKMGIPAVSGSNFIVNRDSYFESGGFAPELTVNEDSELGWRLSQQGYDIKFKKDLIVYSHDHRRLRKGTTRKTLHSLARCLLLYLNILPRAWRINDWGYWSSS